jgi:hypothetical protein
MFIFSHLQVFSTCLCDFFSFKNPSARHWWLTPEIPATQKAESRKIEVRSQPRQMVLETLKPITKKVWGREAQGVGPEFKPQYCKKQKRICCVIYKYL